MSATAIWYLVAGLCLFIGAAECDAFANETNGWTVISLAVALVGWPVVVAALLFRRLAIWWDR